MQGLFLGGGSIAQVYSPQLKKRLAELVHMDTEQIFTRETLAQHKVLTSEADFIFTTWGMSALTAEEIDTYFPKLRAVFYAAGSVQGFARPFLEKGIKVLSAWHANGVPVAEFTVGQILLAGKGYFQSAQLYKQGSFAQANAYSGGFPGNYGAAVGLLGAGVIGRKVIELLHSFKQEICVFDPFLSQEAAQNLGVEKVELEELFTRCQTVSNHLANNPQTVGMLHYGLFSLMKENATFINTGRGAQIVEEDLVRILTERPAMTALLDVTTLEPLPGGHPFFSLPNVFLTPHIAGSMNQETWRMAEYMIEELERLLEGAPLRYEVTPDMLKTMA